MANTDKDILITPNSGSSSADPKIEYVGADSSGSDTITVEALYDGTKATLSFEGSAGQLFSVVNDLTSDPIFSVNDVSGVPSIEVDSDGEIRLAEFSGNVGIGNSSPSQKLDVTGNIVASGTMTATGGNSTNWNTAYGWGNHASAGYLTSYTDTNTTYSAGTGITLTGTEFSLTDTNAKLNLSGGTLTGALTGTTATFIANAAAGTNALNILGSTNGNGTGITFSDNGSPAASASGQNGYLTYYHGDGASYGSGNAFILSSSESTTTILADGKLMYKEGIYSKPASGTGAGTRKDQNWDTAYGWGDHAGLYLPLAGGTMTGKISMFQNNDIFGLSGTLANYPRLSFYSSEGTHAAKTQTLSGDLIGQIDFNPHTGSSYTGGGKISFISTEDITSSQRGTEARIYSTKTGQSSLSYHQFKDDNLYIKNVGGATHKYWHAGNDGGGSGLDADTVDGIQASSFLRSDTADTATGALTFTGNINQTGGTFISNGFTTTDLDNAWQIAGTSKPQGIAPFRYQNSASNKPESGDNAHWGLNIYAHAGSSGNYPYGHQLSAASSGNIWNRWVSNGTFGTWKKIWDSGNDGSGSGLDADLLDGQHGSYYYSSANPPPTYSKYLRSDTSDTMSGNLSLHGNLLLTGDPTTTNADRTIDFTGFDKEGTTDFSDRAYIRHTINTGGHGGSVLVISSQNDSGDGIAFATNSSSQLKHNSNTIWTAGNDGSGSGLDADLLDGQHGSYYYSAANPPPTYSKYVRSDANDTKSGNLVLQTSGAVTNSTTGLLFEVGGTYNDGRYRTRFRKQDVGGGIPLYIDQSGSTANSYTAQARFGTYSGNNYEFEVYGDINATGNIYDGGNAVWHAGNDGSGSGLDADLLDGQHGSYYAPGSHNHNGVYTPYNDFRSLGTTAFTNGTNPNITTAQIISEIETDGGFDSYSSAFKTSWSYAGNYNLTDAGRFTETAGTSWLTWTDNSSDTTRGNITALAIAPNTGGSAGKMFVYNDQGGSYSPGWREIWTSTSDGSGSGLDADTCDGQHLGSTAYVQFGSVEYYGSTSSNILMQVVGTGDSSASMKWFKGGTDQLLKLDMSGNLTATGGLAFGGIEPTVLYDFNADGTANSFDAADYLQLGGGLATGVDISATPVITTNWSAASGTVYSDNKFRILSAKGNSMDALAASVGNSPEGLGDTTIIGNVEVDGTDTRLTTGLAIDGEKVTVIGDASFTNEIRANGGIALGDNDKATFGTADDLEIYHNGSHSIIEDVGNGSLFLKGDTQLKLMNGSENAVLCQKNAGVSLYYDNYTKLATTSSGIDVTGNLTISGTVDGKDVSTLTRVKKTEFDLVPNSTVVNISGSMSSDVYKYVFVFSDTGMNNGPNNPLLYVNRLGTNAQWTGGWTKAQGTDGSLSSTADILTGFSTYQHPQDGFTIEIFKTNNRWVMRMMCSLGSSGFYIAQGYATNLSRDFISGITLSSGTGYTWNSIEGYILEYFE